MIGTTIAFGSLMIGLGTVTTTIAWMIRGKLDSIETRLDELEDLAGIERASA